MSVWKGAMDTVYYDNSEADEREDCEVKIAGDAIAVSYSEDGEFVLYRGRDHGQGHFVLECPERRGKATLHQLPGSTILEGYWSEEGYRGMWRIALQSAG